MLNRNRKTKRVKWKPSKIGNPFALWMMYQARQVGSRWAVPNVMSAAALSENIVTAPNGQFHNTQFWNKAGITGADSNTDDGTGALNGSTVIGTGNWYLNPKPTAQTLPAGTYTVCLDVISTAGINQTFCFSKDALSSRSATYTATSAWQTFEYTFTLSSTARVSDIRLCAVGGSTAASLAIKNFRIITGSTAKVTPINDGHMYFGDTAVDSKVSKGNGFFSMGAGGFGYVALPEAKTLSSLTIMALVRKTSAGGTGQAILSDPTNVNNFNFGLEVSGKPDARLSGNGRAFAGTDNFWDLTGRGWHMLTLTHNAVTTETNIYLDTYKLFTVTGAISATQIRHLWAGVYSNTSLLMSGDIAAIAMYDYCFTKVQQATYYKELVKHITSKTSITHTHISDVVVTVGDSLSVNGQWISVAGASLNPKRIGKSYAVQGYAISHLNLQAPTIDAIWPADGTGLNAHLIIFIGANDLANTGAYPTANNWLSALTSYINARKAATPYLKITVATVLPQGTAEHNTRRAVVNPLIEALVGAGTIQYVLPFGANATVGGDSAPNDITLYDTDKKHLTVLGHTYLAADAIPVLNSY